jgi:GPI ethanolamine phosphate transferase 1
LSISVEGLFYLAYSITLIIWIEVEAALRAGETVKDGYRFRREDARIAMFFLFFVQVAFFGTGK